MPHIARNILGSLGMQNQDDLRDAVAVFESEIGVPVRLMQPGQGRTVSGHTQRWTGESSNMDQYEGFTEEQRDSSGLTILFASWNTDIHVDDTVQYRYTYIPGDFYLEWNRERSHGYSEQQMPEFNEDTILAAGGIPFSFDVDPEGDGPRPQTYAEFFETRVCFVSFTPRGATDWGRLNWKTALFDKIIENFSDEAREAAALRRAEQQREIFTRMMEDQGNVAIVNLRNEAADKASIIGEAEVTLTNAKIDAEQIAKQLRYLLDEEGELSREEIENEWNAIQEHISVKSFTLSKVARNQDDQGLTRQQRRRRERGEAIDNTSEMGASLILKTVPLWIEHPNTKRKVPLGEFEITLDFAGNYMRIKNLTNPQQDGRWDHPHVERNVLCAADYGSTITTLLRQRKLAGMVGMVFSILKTLTMTDTTAVNNMRMWEDADDRLRRENGWEPWAEGEEKHPMIAEQESDDGNTDEDAGDTDEEDDNG